MGSTAQFGLRVQPGETKHDQFLLLKQGLGKYSEGISPFYGLLQSLMWFATLQLLLLVPFESFSHEMLLLERESYLDYSAD